ncbi:MAG: hypothetical protein Q8P18_20385 [Pseudomonadota bacterium]|nr:hypothetical protein [Pseudomonadota bacterium]
MVHSIEFHGRLCRAGEPPANPGLYDLLFRLHASLTGEDVLWQDEVRAISVGAGGYYHAVLGAGNALERHHFDGSPRFLSVRLLLSGHCTEEAADRVPLLGLLVHFADNVASMDARLTALESGGAGARDTVARRRTRLLRRRFFGLEHGEGGFVSLAGRIAMLESRLTRVDGAAGRLARIDDELADLIGPDGDVVDLDARLCRLEGGTLPGEPDRLAVLERRLNELEARLKRR